jgi:hypothetical protein
MVHWLFHDGRFLRWHQARNNLAAVCYRDRLGLLTNLTQYFASMSL